MNHKEKKNETPPPPKKKTKQNGVNPDAQEGYAVSASCKTPTVLLI